MVEGSMETSNVSTVQFQYDSMKKKLMTFGVTYDKYSRYVLAGTTSDTSVNAVHYIENNFPTVRFNLDDDELKELRNWCEERFGDNWIYSYNRFTFKYESDAVYATLVWMKP